MLYAIAMGQIITRQAIVQPYSLRFVHLAVVCMHYDVRSEDIRVHVPRSAMYIVAVH